MIVTDDFVMLNYPKTGSSFARDIIRKAYAARRNIAHDLLAMAKLREPAFQEVFCKHAFLETVDQHGNVRQIPEKFCNRKLVSIMRDPVDRYLSQYYYRWWVKNPPADIGRIRQQYPSFPDISFEQYYDMMNTFGIARRLGAMPVHEQLGLQTIQFVQFFFRNPEQVLSQIDENFISGDFYQEDMAAVHFLHQENLCAELKGFLVSQAGFKLSELSFIDTSPKINQSEHDKFELPDELLKKIRSREALLYRIFPEYLWQEMPA